MVKGLSAKSKRIKLIEENIGNMLQAIVVGTDFLIRLFLQELRSTTDKWDVMKLFSFCIDKETSWKKKPIGQERNSAIYASDTGLISRIGKELKKLKTPIPKKLSYISEQRVLKRITKKMLKKYFKKCSPSLSIGEIQVKTAWRFHPILARMTRISKSLITNTRGRELGRKDSCICCWWHCKLAQPLWRSVWRTLKRLKINLQYDPAIPLVGIWPKDLTSYSTDTCSGMFIDAQFIINRERKEPECLSTDEWIMKMWYKYTI